MAGGIPLRETPLNYCCNNLPECLKECGNSLPLCPYDHERCPIHIKLTHPDLYEQIFAENKVLGTT